MLKCSFVCLLYVDIDICDLIYMSLSSFKLFYSVCMNTLNKEANIYNSVICHFLITDLNFFFFLQN